MKSSTFTLAALAVMLAFGTATYAKGPMNGQAGSTSAGAGAQTKAGKSANGISGAGAAAGTGTPRGIHTPGTGLITTDGTVPVAGMGTPRGIHTPGTGLITTTDSTVSVAQ
jgi:hypothetical protein